MDSNWAHGRRYRLVLRGELGDSFGFLFDRMHLQRLAGTTVLTGQVTDQAHLLGLIEQIRSWALNSYPSTRTRKRIAVQRVQGWNRAGHDGSPHVAAGRAGRLPLIATALAIFALEGIAGQRLIAGGLLAAGRAWRSS